MSEPAPFRFVSAAQTDVGKIRSLNEDSFLDDPASGIWVVADGVGGHAAGDYASQLVVRLLGQVGARKNAASLLSVVRDQLQKSNDNLQAFAANEGIGIAATTVVVLLCHGNHFAAVWAGDSRIYRLRNRMLDQITRDHSEVQELVDAGLLSPDGARHHPRGNVVTRAVGARGALEPEIVSGELEPGDMFLLCSDGVTKVLQDFEIAVLLTGRSPADAAQALVAAVLDRGAPDNTTALVVACLADGPSAADF